MNGEIRFTVADGFRVMQKVDIVDILTAGNWLGTRRQHRYTKAVRMGDRAFLTRHVIKCPYCGGEVPAYARFQPKTATKVPDRISKTVIDEWASPQYSLFDTYDMGLEKSLALNTVVEPKGKYNCPKCAGVSGAYKDATTITLCWQKDKIILSCSTVNITAIIDLMMRYAKGSGHIVFPVTETVEFNLGKGRSSIQIRGGDNQVLAIQDITFAKDRWLGSETYSLIRGSPLVRRKLIKALKVLHDCAPAFSAKELTPETMISLVQFTGGYPKEFFDAIPYDLLTGNIERSFRSVAKKLHKSQNLPKLYENSYLPQMKSIRKQMFSCPGFFFYLHELEVLWLIIKDPNHFLRILEMSRVYELLSFLHQYPGAVDFIRDFKTEKGTSCLLNKLDQKWEAVQEYARIYCAMSTAMRAREQKNWKKGKVLVRPMASHSTPMPLGVSTINNSTIDGYSFSWLRTKQDYSKAGKALRNCLGRWREDSNPVLVVKKGDRLKAAIEISCDRIVQAYAINNTPIEYDEPLCKAIETWKAINKLKPKHVIIMDDDDDDDELWF